jgi:pSer/pThr/pTyr-binding forkhead associated (FHA) protein
MWLGRGQRSPPSAGLHRLFLMARAVFAVDPAGCVSHGPDIVLEVRVGTLIGRCARAAAVHSGHGIPHMVTPHSNDAKGAGAITILRYRELYLALTPGEYFLGRDRKCNLVIDRDIVSRRHANLRARCDSNIVIEDLGSCNGTCVNGQFIGEAPVSLHPGDWFVIGSDLLEVAPEDDGAQCETSRVVEVLTGRDHVMLVDSGAVVLDDTQTAHGIDLACAIAERTMAAGQCAEVERLLAMPLRNILSDALGSRTINRRVRTKAMQCAVKLAHAVRNPKWLDYALDLLMAENIVCTEEQARQLLQLHERIGEVDPRRLQQYLELLRRKAPTIENLRIIGLLESMGGARPDED